MHIPGPVDQSKGQRNNRRPCDARHETPRVRWILQEPNRRNVNDDNGDERESDNEVNLEDLIVQQPHKKQRTTMMDTLQKVIDHWNSLEHDD